MTSALHFRSATVLGCAHAWSGRTTQRLADVTCKTCTARAKRLHLRPREDFAAVPAFDCERVGDGLRFACPCCGKVNMHGLGDGHRAPHCGCWSDGYVVRELRP
jgi:hypothetical protein